jgi:hypothetical protein
MTHRALPTTLVALLLAVAGVPVVSAQSADSLRARIESPRIVGDTGVAGLTLDELLARANTPGISVAVIHKAIGKWTRTT